jgi:predicted RNA binding protein YcfA (HicA-like mRNA interferase family)
MPKLPCVSGARIIKALRRLGFEVRRERGSHAVLRRGSTVCVVPLHREVDQGTLRGILRQANVTREDLAENL